MELAPDRVVQRGKLAAPTRPNPTPVSRLFSAFHSASAVTPLWAMSGPP
jgi:hypothetical protein